MIIPEFDQAQRDLAELAEKALHGEDVFFSAGSQIVRLTRASKTADSAARGGRGAWRGRVTVGDPFYEPWTDEEMGEIEA